MLVYLSLLFFINLLPLPATSGTIGYLTVGLITCLFFYHYRVGHSGINIYESDSIGIISINILAAQENCGLTSN